MPESFETLRARWLDWLKNDPLQSIWTQIYGMVWDDATFQSLNLARSLSRDTASASQNGMLARFLDASYVAGQSIALSRLIDPRKDVISLRRLVSDLRTYRTLITREAYLAIADAPYDYKPVQSAWIARVAESSKNGVVASWEPVSGPDAWMTSERMHESFDKLCGTSPSDRNRTDCLPESIVAKLESWLANPAILRIQAVRHKFVAHAADPKSRASATHLPSGLTLNEVESAHRSIYRTASAISGIILYDDGHTTPLPVPQYDQFENWAPGLVPEEKVNELHTFWNTYEEKRESWGDDLIEELLATG